MRYYLDTNILVFLKQGNLDCIHRDIAAILDNYSHRLLTSVACAQEFVHLCQIGKIGYDKRRVIDAAEILPWLDSRGIKVVPAETRHVAAMASLPMREGHRDPFDRLIIAQAIADRVPLVSSDRKFSLYERDGLDFVFNDR